MPVFPASSKASSSMDHPRDPKAWPWPLRNTKNHSFRFDEQIIDLRPLSNPVAPASLLLAPQNNCDLRFPKEFHQTFCALIEHFETCRHVFWVRKRLWMTSFPEIFIFQPFWVLKLWWENPAINRRELLQRKKNIPSLQPYWMRLPDRVTSNWMNIYQHLPVCCLNPGWCTPLVIHSAPVGRSR